MPAATAGETRMGGEGRSGTEEVGKVLVLFLVVVVGLLLRGDKRPISEQLDLVEDSLP